MWLYCAKLGHFKLIHRKHLTAANLTDLCNCFSLGKVEMSSLVTENVRQAPPEYTSMGISLTCSEALCWQESLGYPCYKSLLVIPTFLSLSSFYQPQNLWACLSSRISSNEFQQVNLNLTKSKGCSLISEEQEFKLDLPLCYLWIFCAGLDRHRPGACHRTLQRSKAAPPWLQVYPMCCFLPAWPELC